MTFDHDTIRQLEQLHYAMQLGGYFTELADLPGARVATTTMFTDVWYNQAYDVQDRSDPVQALTDVETYLQSRDRHPCVYTTPAIDGVFIKTLAAHGYTAFEEESWMLAAVADVAESTENTFTIKRVTDNYADFASVYQQGLPGPEVADYIDAAINIHCNTPKGTQVEYLLAYDNDTPIGMLGLHMKNNIAGVYAVATIPAARGKGVATALNAEAAGIAVTNSCSYLMLQTVTGEDSEQVFEKLGYKTQFNRTGFVPTAIAESLTHG